MGPYVTGKGQTKHSDAIKKALMTYQNIINSPEKAYIDEEQRKNVIAKCQEIDTWLTNEDIKQERVPKHRDPTLTLELINQKGHELSVYCDPIINTAPPPPPKPEKTEEPAMNGTDPAQDKSTPADPAKPEESATTEQANAGGGEPVQMNTDDKDMQDPTATPA